MIITHERVPVQTSRKHESLNFGIKNPAMVFKLLCDKIYKNPLKTLVQEYIANARDAHREVGKHNIPIHIYFPNEFSDKLIIKDFGPGLSPRRVSEVFIWLGESTKRKSDDYTGGFGIGAKIGWAYTDSFTILSYHNGTLTTYLAYIGENGVGKLDIMSKKDTDEPNGVEIQISVEKHDYNDVEKYVNRACTFWKVKPKLYNSTLSFPKMKKPFGKRFIFIASNTMNNIRSYSSNNGDSYLLPIVDGIMYDPIYYREFINDKIKISYSYSLVMFFRTEEVDVAVNRAELQLTDKTKGSIEGIYDSIRKDRETIETRLLGKFRAAKSNDLDNSYIKSLAVKFQHYEINSIPINDNLKFSFNHRHDKMGISTRDARDVRFYVSERQRYSNSGRRYNRDVSSIPFNAKLYITDGKNRVTMYNNDDKHNLTYGVLLSDKAGTDTRAILENYMRIVAPPKKKQYTPRVKNILSNFNDKKTNEALEEDTPYLFVWHHEHRDESITRTAMVMRYTIALKHLANSAGVKLKIPKIMILPKTKKSLMKHYDLTCMKEFFRTQFVPKIRSALYESFKDVQITDIKNVGYNQTDFISLIQNIKKVPNIKDPYISTIIDYFSRADNHRKLTLGSDNLLEIIRTVYPRKRKPRFLKMNQIKAKRINQLFIHVSNYVLRNYPLVHPSKHSYSYRSNSISEVDKKHIGMYCDAAYNNLEEEFNGLAYIQEIHCLFV